MLLSLRKNGLTSLFKEIRVFKVRGVSALSGPVRDTPHIAQYPFEIVSQRGVSHPFALFS